MTGKPKGQITPKVWKGELFRGVPPPRQLAVPLYDPGESASDPLMDIPPGPSASAPSAFALRLDTIGNPRTATPLEDPMMEYIARLLMKDSKLAGARSRLAKVLDRIRIGTSQAAMPMFRRAIEMAMPLVRLERARTTKLKTTELPGIMTERQRITAAVRLILEASERRKGAFEDRFATECLAVLNRESPVLTKIAEMHRRAASLRNELAKLDSRKARKGTKRRTTMYRY